jgi:hypothetical protein
MATYNMGKSINDLGGSRYAPKGWYKVRIVKEPQIIWNKKGRAYVDAHQEALAEEDSDCRHMYKLDLRIVEHAEYAGIGFDKYITLPNKFDKETLMKTGQTKEDFLLSSAISASSGFGHEVTSDLVFDAGDEAWIYVDIETYKSKNGDTVTQNSVLNSTPMREPKDLAEVSNGTLPDILQNL